MPRVLASLLVLATSATVAPAADVLVAPAVTLDAGKELGAGPRKENSGIVASRQWPGVFWMQNDSGDEPRVYAVRRDGSVFASDRYDAPGTLIGGAINIDWEDIAVDASGHVIVADFGNNENDRRDLVLYYLNEPAPSAGRTTWRRRVFFRFPEQRERPAPRNDFNYDAEALFTLGDTPWIVAKHRSDTNARVYRLDVDAAAPDATIDAKFVHRVELDGQATAADALPDGSRVMVLTYTDLWLFDVTDPAEPLAGPATRVPLKGGADTEAACFLDERTALVAAEASGLLYEVQLPPPRTR
ncbi:MAG: hypothetical protein ACRCT8_06180 [Lacipirellulaceae bacterium]